MLSIIFSKHIEIPIMEEDSYEKNVVMYVSIGEPRHIAGKYFFKKDTSIVEIGRRIFFRASLGSTDPITT